MTSTPRQAEARIGPIGALLCRLAFLAICLPGPALFVAGLTVEPPPSTKDFWGLLAGDAFMTVVGVGFGVLGLRLVARSRRDARHLSAAGVAATAEILSVADRVDGEDPGLTLRLRISGPGFAAFEADVNRPVDPALAPGATLPATVVPADRLFSIP